MRHSEVQTQKKVIVMLQKVFALVSFLSIRGKRINRDLPFI